MAKEKFVAESVVNGENPYLLRRFNSKNQIYDFPASQSIEDHYRNEIKKAFQEEKLSEEKLRSAGLSSKDIQKEISSGDKIYSMFFEYLEDLTGGNPL